MAEYTFIIYGQPSPYAVYARNMGRPPPGFGKMQAWQEQIQLQLRVAYKGEPYHEAVTLDTEFYLAPNKAGQSKKKPESYARWCVDNITKRPDLDNLRKAATDACQGILFVNDSQVVAGTMKKGFIDKFTRPEPFTLIRLSGVAGWHPDESLVRDCTGCGISFEATRPDMTYHSSLCRNATNQRRTYRRNMELAYKVNAEIPRLRS
jgi:Holliday junction resolvase RusA-like endonuclease